MEFAVEVSQQGLSWPEVRERVLLVEELGFHIAWLSDHLKPTYDDPDGPCLDGWTLIAGLASVTTRVRLGVFVTDAAFRHPATLVSQVVTADHLSDGRIEFGIGAGWFRPEHEAFSFPFPILRRRAARLREVVEIAKGLMSGDAFSYEGEHFRLSGAVYRPLPVQRPHPRIWIGGGDEGSILPLAARHADAWHCFADIDDLVGKARRLDALAAECGRSPEEISRSTSFSLDGLSWDEVRREIERLGAAGISIIVIDWPEQGGERLRSFRHEVIVRVP